ncbi:MAG: WXG100 family type VII secretion target [Lachnospiraceae bacterium]|nr:WXG100 family type VII secretion target [Lachnospiraceae bacterium]
MNDQFSLSPEDMLNVGNDFSAKATELESLMKQLSTSVQTLEASWKGAGAEQFISDYASCSTAVTKLVEALRERSTALISGSNLATETAQALTGQWS